MATYFKSNNPSVPFYLSNGGKVQFDDVVGGEAILAVHNPDIVKEFAEAIANQRGGISEITSAQYQDLKKKQGEIKSQQSLREEIRLQDMLKASLLHKQEEAAVVVDSKAKMEQVKIPTPHNKAPTKLFKPVGIKR